ncbi:hypothetical protein C1645_812754 [Glomus cerebriforme]|uniref:Uncharacterized protein n=1 Tax=Glomus cerebriforme TaxID=658196 RepID=A0A397TKJ6_9GLOM|nr:hypothetical protein C1645_812754 [Glomus cerebriforme]
MVPILMTIVVAIISIKTNAIHPFALACDIRNPTWVRLIGYSGFDFILTFVGVYFSVRASYELFKHLDQFKSQITETSSNNKNDTPNLQVYSVTKAAAIRMVLFSIGFALINISATVQSIYLIMKGKDDKFYGGLRGPDFAVAFTGIIIYLIFGLPRMFTKYD